MSSDTSSRSSGSPCSSPTPTKPHSSKSRCNKPQMERKRRERINQSLNVLKQLVLDALKKDTSQYSKLEKADILEMTVKHLRDLQRRQLVTAASNDVSVVGKYRAGFAECATEVSRYLSSVDGLRPDVRDRLMGHLSTCVHRVSTPATESQQQQQQHHQQQQQPQQAMRHPVMTTQVSTANLTSPVTRPIQIQIPVATSPGTLPGAGVQALQLATTVNDVTRLARTPSVSPPQQNVAYSPVAPTAYIGAFHVIPNAQIPTFMLQQQSSRPQQMGLATSTPVYVSTSPLQQVTSQLHQQQQQQQYVQAVQGHTTVVPSSVQGLKRVAHDDLEKVAPPMKKMLNRYEGGIQLGAKLAINETLRDEKVWRPW